MSQQKDLGFIEQENDAASANKAAPVYSHSRINTFENCPLQYKFRYIDKIKRDFESIEAFMGKRFHEVMEFLYLDINYNVQPLESLLAYYEEQWDKEMHPDVVVVKKGKVIDEYRQAGRKCIENYYKSYYPFKQSQTVGIENRISIDLLKDGNYRLMGFIDRLAKAPDGTYEIHDYKTSSSQPKQKYLDMDRQLALYQMAVQEMWEDAEKVKLIWHFVAFNQEITSTRTPEQLEALRRELIRLIDTIEAAEEFIPKESPLCGWCAYQDLCPAKAHLFKTEKKAGDFFDPRSADVYVDKLSKMAIEKGELQSRIKEIDKTSRAMLNEIEAYAAENQVEAIAGSTHCLKISKKETLMLPKKGSEEYEELIEALKTLGKWEAVQGLDLHELEKIIKENAWTSEELAKIQAYYQLQTRRTFTLAKNEK